MDIRGDKSLWEPMNLEGVGKVLLVEETYYESIIEYVELLKRQRDMARSAPFYQCPNCMKRFDKYDYSNDKLKEYEKALQEIMEIHNKHQWNMYGLAYSIAEKAILG